ncbi:MAG: pyrroline-5-carboxylate reductase [Chthoniobacterales bacterium]|nr:pyrroline-5-carboxylate reductase [Chthoniobacterales bacterium]
MGSALARGVVAGDVCLPGDIGLYDTESRVARELAEALGASVAAAAPALAAQSDVIVLCVKPKDAAGVLSPLRRELDGKLLVSIAAGISIASMQSAVGAGCRIVRVMPNTPVMVGKGASAYACGGGVTATDTDNVQKIFGSAGRAFRVEEGMLDAVTGLSGSGPAYVYLFIEALAEGGVAAGLPRELALALAVQTVSGAAEMVEATKMSPAQLRDMVTSPGGTTVEGLAALDRAGFAAAVKDAVVAAAKRSEELGRSNA